MPFKYGTGTGSKQCETGINIFITLQQCCGSPGPYPDSGEVGHQNPRSPYPEPDPNILT